MHARIAETWEGVLSAVSVQGDPDRVFSYYTRQQVQFLDAKLGVTFAFIQFGIAAFIVGYVFIYKQGYLSFEQAKGATVAHVSGDALASSSGKDADRYFSTEELTFPGLENGNVFVATRETVHRQMRGRCEDPDVPCLSNDDCTPGGQGICTDNGICLEHSWCSVEHEPEIYAIASDMIQIWARSFIQFLKIAPERLFTTEDEQVGPNSDNTFTVRELLQMCNPPVNYEEVSELGAAFEVSFRWNCNVKSKCKPNVEVRRLDTILEPDNIGFGFKHAEYLDGGHRLQNEVRGLRFFFRTSGVGSKVSASATITTASTCGTLMSFAVVVADLLLTKVFSNRKKYMARKFEKTPDFSSYIEALEERKKYCTKISDLEKAENKVEQNEAVWMAKFQEEGV